MGRRVSCVNPLYGPGEPNNPMLNSSSPTARKPLPLHIKVLLGFILGGLLGLAAHFYAVDAPLTQYVIAYVTKPLGQIFLNLLFMAKVRALPDTPAAFARNQPSAFASRSSTGVKSLPSG